jgi:type IV pilus assembly protein PilC
MKIDIRKEKATNTGLKNESKKKSNSRITLKRSERIEFYRELAELTDARIDLYRALDLMYDAKKKRKAQLVTLLKSKMEGGLELAEAFEEIGCFSPFEIESIRAAEKSGRLNKVLYNIIEFYSYNQRLTRILTSSLSYPVMLMIASLIVISFMLSFVVPMFQDIYKQTNQEMPQITLYLLAISAFFQKYYLFLFGLFTGVVLVIRYTLQNPKYRVLWERLIFKIPMVGTMYKNIIKAKIISILFYLLEAKVPVKNAIEQSAKVTKNLLVKDEINHSIRSISEGKPIHTTFGNISVFTTAERKLIELGEETSRLANTFEHLTDNIISRLEHDAKLMGKLLEPILIGFVSIFIALTLISLYLPLFSLRM